MPFDVQDLRCVHYRLDSDGRPIDVESMSETIVQALRAAEDAHTDSPVFQLVEGLPAPQLDHSKTDVFREQVRYSKEVRERLAAARAQEEEEGLRSLQAIEERLGNIANVEAGVVIDLFLSYRAIRAWEEMIRLADLMSRPLQESVMVQEQLALALNRGGQGDKAERVLLDLAERRGPSSETYGILGRVYKDRWEAAATAGQRLLAQGLLDKAIDAYVKGLEADWRDPYPGINALTLMELRDPPDIRRDEIRPVVTYSAKRRMASGKPDYWDYATLLELAVLGRDEAAAIDAITSALAAIREPWEPETTARNLSLIRRARASRSEPLPWADELEQELLNRAKK